jgi:hypothetical protein
MTRDDSVRARAAPNSSRAASLLLHMLRSRQTNAERTQRRGCHSGSGTGAMRMKAQRRRSRIAANACCFVATSSCQASALGPDVRSAASLGTAALREADGAAPAAAAVGLRTAPRTAVALPARSAAASVVLGVVPRSPTAGERLRAKLSPAALPGAGGGAFLCASSARSSSWARARSAVNASDSASASSNAD